MRIDSREQYINSQLNRTNGAPRSERIIAGSNSSTEDKVSLSPEGKKAQQSGKVVPQQQDTYRFPPAVKISYDEVEKLRNPKEVEKTFLEKAMQSALDRRMGIDRERLEELEAKIKELEAKEDAIRQNEDMPQDKKNALLDALQDEKNKLYDLLEAEKKRMAEQAAEKEGNKNNDQSVAEKVLNEAI